MTFCSIAARPFLAGLRCTVCGSPDILSVQPGSDIGTLDDPQPVVAITGRCRAHQQNTAGSAHGASSPAASQRAEWVGA